MFLRRSAVMLARQARSRPPIAARSFTTTIVRRDAHGHSAAPTTPSDTSKLKSLEEIKQNDDILPPGAEPGTVPTDLNQSTGLERLEILGKMEGIDIFDMKPLDSSRKGTMQDPIVVKSWGEEQYVGCCGVPADSHNQIWMTISRERPIERCTECGNVIKMDYIGPEDPHHGHGPYVYEGEPKTFVDYLKPEYKY